MLEVKGLRRHFELAAPMVVRAVQDVSFSVSRGEVLAIVGESGCGKTTVARMLVGLTDPDTGSIAVDGQQLTGSRSQADRRLIQLVSQNPWSALNRSRSIGHALEQPLLVHHPLLSKQERLQAVAEMAVRVSLPVGHLSRRPAALSGGELSRAVLARALLAAPKIVVLDEPTASLDASVKAAMVNLLLDLQAELGLCLVLITHEIPIARRIADRVAVMYLGRFVETGPARQVLKAPVHPYTRMLLASAPSSRPGEHPAVPIQGEIPSSVRIPAGCAYHPRCPYQEAGCSAAVPELLALRSGQVACHRTAYLDQPTVRRNLDPGTET